MEYRIIRWEEKWKSNGQGNKKKKGMKMIQITEK
jgi:hypothetical protein